MYEFPTWNGHKYKPENIHTFLGDMNRKKSFPKVLSLSKTLYPVRYPKKGFYDPIEIDIYVTSTDKFTTKPRDVFSNFSIKHTDSKEAYAWLQRPSMSYFDQQLNFACWCASAGCGVSLQMLEMFNDIPIISSLLNFHLYFTIRRILGKLGAPLPGDKFFNPKQNNYDQSAYNALCREFNISPSTDWRYHESENDGLGTLFKKMLDGKTYKVSELYEAEMNGLKTGQWPGGYFFFSDQGASWGDKNFTFAASQEKMPYTKFMLTEDSSGLTLAGLSRLNQSIESYVYCILGAQVNSRSSIVGSSGSSVETQAVFEDLLESLIIEKDVSKSIQRFQLAIQESKVRLDLAVGPSLWLMPSNMIMNTNSTVGYNNELKKATSEMGFGINSDLNQSTKSIGIQAHNLGGSKTNLPHKPDNNGEVKPKPDVSKTDVMTQRVTTDRHSTNLTVITVSAAGLAWYLFR